MHPSARTVKDGIVAAVRIGLRLELAAGKPSAAMRNLTAEPAWKEEDLGSPLPDSAHACSVCLPNWKAVIGYEENLDRVRRRLRTGYPRFFRHPLVERLFLNAKAEVAMEGEEVLVLPTRASVQRAHRWVERRSETALRITSYHGLQVLVVPAKAKHEADQYWRFSGEIVSSRQAQEFLEGGLRDGSKSHLVSRALAKYYGAEPEDLFVFSSGMAAVTSVLRALPGLRDGKKTLQLEFPYVDCLKVQDVFGHGAAYLNEAEGEPFDEALQRIRQGEFAGVFTEVASNPLLRTVDLPRVAEACREGGTPLVVDDSVAGPLNVDALRFADVVTSSLTKWISGEGDVMAGMAVVRADSAVADQLRESLVVDASDSAPLYIADAEVLLSNLKDYPKRNPIHNSNGAALAAWLAAHPAIEKVWHPSLTTADAYQAAQRKGGGCGGLLSFVLKTRRKTPKVYDSLALCKGPSFGTVFTLVSPYTLLAHYDQLEWAESCGIPAHLLRVSCGLEPFETIRDAFAEALEHA